MQRSNHGSAYRTALAVFAAALALAACGGGGGSSLPHTNPQQPTPSPTPTAAPSSLPSPAAQSNSASVTPSTSAATTATLPATGGITASVTVPALASGSGTLNVTIATGSDATMARARAAAARHPLAMAGGPYLLQMDFVPSQTITLSAAPSFSLDVTQYVTGAGLTVSQAAALLQNESVYAGVVDNAGNFNVVGPLKVAATSTTLTVNYTGPAVALTLLANQHYTVGVHLGPITAPTSSPTASPTPTPTALPTATPTPTPTPTAMPTGTPAPVAATHLYVAGQTTLYAFNLPLGTGQTAIPVEQYGNSETISGLATDGRGTLAVETSSAIYLYRGVPAANNPAFATYAFGSGQLPGAWGNGAAFDSKGNLYVTEANSAGWSVLQFLAPLSATTPSTVLNVCSMCGGITFDTASDTMYVSDIASQSGCGMGQAESVDVVAYPYTSGSQSVQTMSCSNNRLGDVDYVASSDGVAGLWWLDNSGLHSPQAIITNTQLGCGGQGGTASNFAVYANTFYVSNDINSQEVCSYSPAAAYPSGGWSSTGGGVLPNGDSPSMLSVGP